MTNPAKILHGGVIAAIMDDLMGMTIITLNLENFFTTVNLSIDYLASAEIGETIIATTQINRKGRQIINAGCILSNEAGKILAKGTTNLVITALILNQKADALPSG